LGAEVSDRSGVDPRGVIREAYRIEGITHQDCRTIFFGWALDADGALGPAAIRALLDAYGAQAPDHPMTAVLREGVEHGTRTPARRGGNRRRAKRGGG
jgi:hypothetical protein